MTNNEIKELCHSLGADLVGVALVERFVNVSKGHHPTDVMPAGVAAELKKLKHKAVSIVSLSGKFVPTLRDIFEAERSFFPFIQYHVE